MALEMILNELSVTPAPDIDIAQQRMLLFIDAMRAATACKVSRVLRTQENVWSMELAPAYPLSRWRNDNNVTREARSYFKTLATKAPYWYDDPDLHEKINESEFVLDQHPALGLGVAYLLDSLALSLSSNEVWNAAALEMQVNWLEENDVEEVQLQSRSVSVIHASAPAHIATNQAWIEQRLRRDITDGSELWRSREVLFPKLGFCPAIQRQIEHIEKIMLRPVIHRLMELNAYCEDWMEGGFDPDSIPSKVSPESEVTLQQYGGARTFMCPDGIERTFSWHVRLTPNAWRLYFHPVPEHRQLIIGYIGPKPDTVKYH